MRRFVLCGSAVIIAFCALAATSNQQRTPMADLELRAWTAGAPPFDRDAAIDRAVKAKLAEKMKLDLRGSFTVGQPLVLVSDRTIPEGVATLTHMANQLAAKRAEQRAAKKRR